MGTEGKGWGLLYQIKEIAEAFSGEHPRSQTFCQV